MRRNLARHELLNAINGILNYVSENQIKTNETKCMMRVIWIIINTFVLQRIEHLQKNQSLERFATPKKFDSKKVLELIKR